MTADQTSVDHSDETERDLEWRGVAAEQRDALSERAGIKLAARSQALRLPAWNEKAYTADLALRTLTTLAGQIRAGRCASFVAHVYDELTDLRQAYAGEDWRPMIAVVAHDPSVASQCRPAPLLAASRLESTLKSDLNLAW